MRRYEWDDMQSVFTSSTLGYGSQKLYVGGLRLYNEGDMSVRNKGQSFDEGVHTPGGVGGAAVDKKGHLIVKSGSMPYRGTGKVARSPRERCVHDHRRPAGEAVVTRQFVCKGV
jgi:hypothetical protein